MVYQPLAEVAYLYLSTIVFVVFLFHKAIKSYRGEENCSRPTRSLVPISELMALPVPAGVAATSLSSPWYNNETYRENCGYDIPSDGNCDSSNDREGVCEPSDSPPAAKCVVTKEMMEAALTRSAEDEVKSLKKARYEKDAADIAWLRGLLGKSFIVMPQSNAAEHVADEHTVCHRCGSSILNAVNGKWVRIPCPNSSCKVSSLTETTPDLDYGNLEDAKLQTTKVDSQGREMMGNLEPEGSEESDDAEREVENGEHVCPNCGRVIVDYVCGRWRRVPCSCPKEKEKDKDDFVCHKCKFHIVESVYGDEIYAACGCQQLKFPVKREFVSHAEKWK